MSADRALGGGVVRRRRLQLLALAALFVGPLGLAAWLYYHAGSWRPAGRLNHGVLVTPPRELPPLALRSAAGGPADATLLHGRWSLLTITDSACGLRCRRALADSAAARIALAADAWRVQLVLLADRGCCERELGAAEQRDLVTVWLDAGERGRLGDSLAAAGAPAEAGRIYLVDPHGNLVMSYPPGAERRGLLQDLERLLRLSQIG